MTTNKKLSLAECKANMRKINMDNNEETDMDILLMLMERGQVIENRFDNYVVNAVHEYHKKSS